MDLKKLNPGPEYFEQLALGLQLDDGAADQDWRTFVSPEEARKRSLAAQSALISLGQEERAPEWMEQYQQLLNAGWPWRVACYIAWAASPKKTRWPKTQEELATEVLGLTGDRQIGTWRKKNPAIDEVIAVLQAAPLMAHRADVMQALADAASDPDHRNNPDRKLYLELIGDYVPRAKVDLSKPVDGDDLSQFDEAELRRIAKRIQGTLDPGASDGGGGDNADDNDAA